MSLFDLWLPIRPKLRKALLCLACISVKKLEFGVSKVEGLKVEGGFRVDALLASGEGVGPCRLDVHG